MLLPASAAEDQLNAAFRKTQLDHLKMHILFDKDFVSLLYDQLSLISEQREKKNSMTIFDVDK